VEISHGKEAAGPFSRSLLPRHRPGNKGAKVFKTAKDFKLYLRFLKEYKKRYPFLLYAYVLMPTHVHLLIEVQETPLSKIMQSLQFRYTRHYNLKYRTWGHLF